MGFNDFLDINHFLPVLIGVAGLCALLTRDALGRNSRSVTMPDTAKDISPSLTAALVMGAMLWRIAVLLIMEREGLNVFEGDEIARWHISYQWSQRPFFFTGWDGIWLSGDFAFFGTMMRLFHSPLTGVMAGVLIGHFMTIFAAFFLAWTLSDRFWIGAVAAWLIAPGCIFLWIGHGPLVEGTMAGYFMMALAFTWRFASSDKSHPKAQWLHTAGAGLFFFFTASLHYLGWMAIIVALAFLLAGMWFRRASLGCSGITASLLIFLGSAAFPLLWMVGSWRAFGSPLQFLRNQNGMNQFFMNERHLAGDLQRAFTSNMKLLSDGAALLLPVLSVGLFPIRRRAQAQAWLALTALIVVLVALIVIAGYLSGNYMTVHRYLIIPYACMIVSVATALPTVEDIWIKPAEWAKTRRCFAFACFGLIFIPWLDYNARMTWHPPEYYTKRTWHHDVFALATWLQMEFQTPQSAGFAKRRVRIGYCNPDPAFNWLDFLNYQTGHPRNFKVIPERALVSGTFDPTLDYIILGKEFSIKGFALMTQFGQWRVMERRETAPVGQ